MCCRSPYSFDTCDANRPLAAYTVPGLRPLAPPATAQLQENAQFLAVLRPIKCTCASFPGIPCSTAPNYVHWCNFSLDSLQYLFQSKEGQPMPNAKWEKVFSGRKMPSKLFSPFLHHPHARQRARAYWAFPFCPGSLAPRRRRIAYTPAPVPFRQTYVSGVSNPYRPATLLGFLCNIASQVCCTLRHLRQALSGRISPFYLPNLFSSAGCVASVAFRSAPSLPRRHCRLRLAISSRGSLPFTRPRAPEQPASSASRTEEGNDEVGRTEIAGRGRH